MFKATPAYKGQLSSFLGKLCMAKEGKEKTRNIRNQTEQKEYLTCSCKGFLGPFKTTFEGTETVWSELCWLLTSALG